MLYDMNIKVGDQFEIDGEYTVKGFLLDGGKLPDELAIKFLVEISL